MASTLLYAQSLPSMPHCLPTLQRGCPPLQPSLSQLHLLRNGFPAPSSGPITAQVRAHTTFTTVLAAADAKTSEVEEIVIVGGGIAGMSTALALHRLGMKSVVLEQSPTLRTTGTAIATWTNGWLALEALGIADGLRDQFTRLSGFEFYTADGKCLSKLSFENEHRDVELRAVHRKVLLEALQDPLPTGTVHYDARVKDIHKVDGGYTQVDLQNGSSIKAKVVLGCDGIGSIVARHMGLGHAHYAGYTGIRGLGIFPEGHNFDNVLKQTLGRGVRLGCLPLDTNRVYWFLVFNAPADKKIKDVELIKMEALGHVTGFPQNIVELIRKSPAETFSRSAISDRWMWPFIEPKMHDGGVTIAGDAMHAITPNLAQGGCCALEDGVILARMLSQVLKGANDSEEMKRIESTLASYTRERQQRMFPMQVKAYAIGALLQFDLAFIYLARNALLPKMLKVSSFIDHTFYNCATGTFLP